MKATRFPKTRLLFLALVALFACTKAPETGPCETVPAHYSVSLFKPPVLEEAKFFTSNYKACKKRNLKRDPNALFSVGVSVLHGLGTEKDPMKAFLWFKGAADKDHRGARELLAHMFTQGVGVIRDPGIGRKYFESIQHPPLGG